MNSGSLIAGSTGTFLSGIRVIMACHKQSNMHSDTLTSRSWHVGAKYEHKWMDQASLGKTFISLILYRRI